MAIFDVEQQRVCVRVVYDGVASAGKTTNLRQLAELFATQRASEVISPAEMDGRTLYFDWLQIAAGMVCGFPLVCQVITVPGQVVLTPRRRHLLATADVVVYVTDSDESAIARALEGLATFEQIQEQRGELVPLVLQANKQDQPGALSGLDFATALGRHDVPTVEAIASDGIGVVDTFVTAVRAGVRAIQARVESGKVKVAVQAAETPDDALAKLSTVEVDPEWAAEMILEEAANAMSAVDLAELVDSGEEEIEPEPDTWKPGRLANLVPVLPTENVPTGFVWPAHTGRASLAALAAEPGMKEPIHLEGDGTVRRTIGEFVLSTGRDRHFESPEAARQALVRAARARTQLGALLEPETLLVAQPAPDGTSWLWTIEPRMPSVHQLASNPANREPPVALLSAYGTALADALKVEATHGVPLDLSPRSFGLRAGAVRYVGSVPPPTAAPRNAGHAIEGALLALAGCGETLEPTTSALESAIVAKLSSGDLSRLALATTWSTAPMPATVSEAARRIEEAFTRGRKAA